MQVGFLYLRYFADPKTLWNWYEPYIKDDEVCKSSTTFLDVLLPNVVFYLFSSD